MSMDCVVQWATILSPIIAVVIAIWTSRSSAKDTAKKIAAIEESTKNQIAALEQSTQKQLKSVKKLARIHTETSQIQIEKELWEARKRYLLAIKEEGDAMEYDHFFNQIGGVSDSLRQREEKNRKLTNEKDFYKEYAKMLEQYHSRINKLSKELEEM